jgi:hypothetical protein
MSSFVRRIQPDEELVPMVQGSLVPWMRYSVSLLPECLRFNLPTPDARLPRNALGRAARRCRKRRTLGRRSGLGRSRSAPAGTRRALGARITGSDWADGGLTPDDAVTLGKALKDVGLDYIDVFGRCDG